MQTYLVTGGSGFIGSAVIRHLIANTDSSVINVDIQTYAATKGSTEFVADNERYELEIANICDKSAMADIFNKYQPDYVLHLAAETHVDRSIDGPSAFIETNIIGVYTLLEVALNYWRDLNQVKKDGFRFLHVSTDEVFGSLDMDSPPFNPDTSYRPRSPYSASKASADHLVHAWGETYGLPVLISNCSNNYGPYQFPEKLIPVVIFKALAGEPIPVYGTGENIRDWLFVEDHANAIVTIVQKGDLHKSYLVGGGHEVSNIDIVRSVCRLLDQRVKSNKPREEFIEFVADRPGHDLRYAIDDSQTRESLDWAPKESFETGLSKTIDWYMDNREWWEDILANKYDGERLGKVKN